VAHDDCDVHGQHPALRLSTNGVGVEWRVSAGLDPVAPRPDCRSAGAGRLCLTVRRPGRPSGARHRGDGDGPNGHSPNGGSLAH
jgi:hypothetical protein